MDRLLFAFQVELPLEFLPPVVELPVEAFLVWRSVRAIPSAEHISHLEGASPSTWQATPCNRVGKAAEVGRDLACRGLTFVAPDGANCLLDASRNILEVGQLLFPIFFGQAPSFEDTLDWL